MSEQACVDYDIFHSLFVSLAKSLKSTDVWRFPTLEKISATTNHMKIGGRCVAFEGDPGWAKYRARTMLTESISKLNEEEYKKLGNVLFAEWVGGSSFFRVFPDPGSPGNLVVVQVTEGSGNETYLRQIVEVAGDGAAAGKTLKYHIYWKIEDDGNVSRAFDAFAGFSKPTDFDGIDM